MTLLTSTTTRIIDEADRDKQGQQTAGLDQPV